MPALMVGQINVSRFAKDGLRAAPFELWVLFAVGLLAKDLSGGFREPQGLGIN
jgi:hypothetical protein